MDPVDVVVVGQTPPPYHGQAVMIHAMLAGKYERVRMHHVRMQFSRSIEQIGRPSAGKIAHLVSVIAKIVWVRARHRAHVLYYPPAGPGRVPVFRDIAILITTRWMFSHVVFHFHAGGLTDFGESLHGVRRWLFDRAYRFPDVAIQLSDLNPPDGRRLGAHSTRIIPYGIDDLASATPPPATHHVRDDVPTILFVGAVRESKGVTDLLDALAGLKSEGVAFRANLVGEFADGEYESVVRARIAATGLEDTVVLRGGLAGVDKWNAYRAADVFCFPTYYESETFGVVLLEAMQFELPVVATKWRGVPSIVDDEVTGLLVDPRDVENLRACLARLLQNPELRVSMGRAGRQRYLADFTIDRWRARIETALIPN